MQYLIIFSLLGLLLLSEQSSAETFSSGTQQVHTIELFTSEGCSSCPPADRWLTNLTTADGLWDTFVPMAFHVDYWDYIGWRDPFASREFSQRQRQYAREYNESTVYTPGVRRGGREWRNWRFFTGPKAASGNEVGRLMITVADGRFSAKFDPATKGLRFNIAILGIDLSSEVLRGENRGKTLRHNFVVLGTSNHSSAEGGIWQGKLPARSLDAPRYAVAAWVSKTGSLTPIQATGGFLETSPN